MDYGLFFLFAVLSSMRPNFDIIRSRMRTVLIDSLRAIPGGVSGFRSAHRNLRSIVKRPWLQGIEFLGIRFRV
jgi:hypothetical protein